MRRSRALRLAFSPPNSVHVRAARYSRFPHQPCRSLESSTADLARKVVQLPEPVAYRGAPPNAIDCRRLWAKGGQDLNIEYFLPLSGARCRGSSAWSMTDGALWGQPCQIRVAFLESARLCELTHM